MTDQNTKQQFTDDNQNINDEEFYDNDQSISEWSLKDEFFDEELEYWDYDEDEYDDIDEIDDLTVKKTQKKKKSKNDDPRDDDDDRWEDDDDYYEADWDMRTNYNRSDDDDED